MEVGDRVRHINKDKNIQGLYLGQATYYSHTSINANIVVDIIRGTKGKLEQVEKIKKYQTINKLISVSLLDLDDRAGITVIDTEDFLAKYIKIEPKPIFQPDLFSGLDDKNER
jgi:hypothetical protein